MRSDKSTAELVTVAFKCAAAVYQADPKVTDDAPNLTGLHRNPETAGIKFSELEYVFPSFGGSSKAIGFWIAESEVTQSANPDFPALVIAVRGTEKFIDHIVNANGRPIAAADFFVRLFIFALLIPSYLLMHNRAPPNINFSILSQMICRRTRAS